MLTLIILFAGLFVGLIGAGLVGLAVESYAEKQSRKEKIKAAILRLKDDRKAGKHAQRGIQKNRLEDEL